jgi:hypothetical protein
MIQPSQKVLNPLPVLLHPLGITEKTAAMVAAYGNRPGGSAARRLVADPLTLATR